MDNRTGKTEDSIISTCRSLPIPGYWINYPRRNNDSFDAIDTLIKQNNFDAIDMHIT